MKLHEGTFGSHLKLSARRPEALDKAKALATGQAATNGRMVHVAARGAMAHHATTSDVDRSVDNEMHIGSIAVHTAATDARGIAADIEPHLRRGQAVGRADYGLA